MTSSISLRRLALLTAGLAVALAGCDRVKTALRTPMGDPVWQGDSALVAAKPTVLFRVVRDSLATRIVPIATGGTTTFQPMTMSNRGWRLFDLQYLHDQREVVPIRGGTPMAATPIKRGMWEGDVLDTIPGCAVMPPAALVDVPKDIDLVAQGPGVKAIPVTPLSEGDRAAALASLTTLIAPSAGVSPSLMSRYRRTVSVVPTGASRGETIVVTLEDPESAPDSLAPIAQRPREVIIVLDKGIYGYKPTYVFKTVGNMRDVPRRRFLGAFDADGNGKAELFFGVQSKQWVLVTYGLRWEVDAWHETFRYERGRCHG